MTSWVLASPAVETVNCEPCVSDVGGPIRDTDTLRRRIVLFGCPAFFLFYAILKKAK